MAWRGPRFAFLHAARAAGVSALTASHTIDADYPLAFLIDHRRLPTKFDASGTGRYIDLDRGAAGLEVIGRLYIPSGHNLDGATQIDVDSSTSGAFAGEETSRVSQGTIPTGDIDEDFGAETSDRYLRFSITGTGTWEIPELLYTRTRTTGFGPDTEWTDQDRSNVEVLRKTSGDRAILETGSRQRELELRYNAITGADRTLLRELIDAVGLAEPFLIDPPAEDDTSLQADEAVLWVEFEREPQIRGEWLGGVKGDTFRSLQMLEVIG